MLRNYIRRAEDDAPHSFETLNTPERLEQLTTAAARLWQPIEAMACTPTELVHVELATLLEEISQTGVQVA